MQVLRESAVIAISFARNVIIHVRDLRPLRHTLPDVHRCLCARRHFSRSTFERARIAHQLQKCGISVAAFHHFDVARVFTVDRIHKEHTVAAAFRIFLVVAQRGSVLDRYPFVPAGNKSVFHVIADGILPHFFKIQTRVNGVVRMIRPVRQRISSPPHYIGKVRRKKGIREGQLVVLRHRHVDRVRIDRLRFIPIHPRQSVFVLRFVRPE